MSALEFEMTLGRWRIVESTSDPGNGISDSDWRSLGRRRDHPAKFHFANAARSFQIGEQTFDSDVWGPSDGPRKEAGEAGVPSVGRTVGPTLIDDVWKR